MLDRLTIGRLRAWTGEKPVLLALSGGGDSVALLRLLHVELGPSGVRAAIVDHALREGSAVDAERAKALAENLGVRADILTLSWPQNANRAQQAAREARYRVLCEHARSNGLNAIATAHTADDQAETVLMRAARDSTWRGLAGIAPFSFAPLWPEGRGIALARPLLGARREALRAYLYEQCAEWIEDPANANPAFERVRVRQRLAELEASGVDPMRLARLATRMRSRAEEQNRLASALIQIAVQFDQDRVIINLSAWRNAEGVRLRALSALLAAASGGNRGPAHDAIARLDAQLVNTGFRGASLGGALLKRMRQSVVITRDPGAVEGRAGVDPMPSMTLQRGVELVWDGRLLVRPVIDGVRLEPAAPAPRLRLGEMAAPANAVSIRWLLAERVAHALGTDVLDVANV